MYYVLSESGDYPNCYYFNEFQTEEEAVNYYTSQGRYSTTCRFIKGEELKLGLKEE